MADTGASTARSGSPADAIAFAVRQLILDRQLAPGEKLREQDLATRFGVSRTPVREALTALESEGLLVYEMNRGYTVRQFSLTDLLESYEMRALLEGHACRIAAERGLAPELGRDLAECLDRADALLAPGQELDADELKSWHAHNFRFHNLLLRVVPSRLFERMAMSVYHVPRIFDLVDIAPDLAALKRYGEEHRRIHEAIVLRQSQRAEFLMREHIQRASDLIVQRMMASGQDEAKRFLWPPAV